MNSINSQNSPNTFRSGDISNTKARETQYFEYTIKEPKVRQTLDKIRQKTHEVGLKINNIFFVREVVSGKEKIKLKPKLVRYAICLAVVTAVGLGGYFAYTTIKEHLTITTEKANALFETNPDKAIEMYNQLIEKDTIIEHKISLLYDRIYELSKIPNGKYNEQILKDARQAYELYPSYNTIEKIIEVEIRYGTEEEVKEWKEKLEEYRGIEIKISND